ncbi:UPF0182 family protein [Prochlorococcus sp. MIT 1341]|uniref:UPF0182 family protein n=1 Tax=Prochlorococcus sp. MIT 1341 TaxID=3096221 RepID=UPI002A762C60|nr:UPF0182 family protein [Prochlorococcus sp. MIT 1341]
MTKLTALTANFLSKPKVLALGAGLIVILYVLMRLHVESIWFSQFSYSEVIYKRWLLQAIGFAGSSFLVIAGRLWQKKWFKRLKLDYDQNNKNKIKGIKYTLFLTSTFLVTLLIIGLLGMVSWTALNQPFKLSEIHTLIRPSNIEYIILTAVLSYTSYLLLLKRGGYKIVFLLGGLFFSLIVSRAWGIWAIAFTIPSGNIVEPVFGSNINFSLAIYPAIQLILFLMFSIHTLLVSTSIWAKLSYGSAFSDWMCNDFAYSQKKYIKPMGSISLVYIAAFLWLSRYNFLWIQHDARSGASWLDIHQNIPLRTSASLLVIVGAVLVAIPLSNKRLSKLSIFSLVLALFTLISESLLSPIVNWIVVRPRELTLESPYILRSINSTRKAFQLDSIKTELISPNQKLTKDDLKKGSSTLKNIRLWDSQPLLATNKQLQQLRVYYRFSSASVDRYQLRPGTNERQQVIVAARELDQESLPESSRTWLNKHFVFTHGYGFTLSPVNTKAIDGLPDYFISDLGSSRRIEGSPQLGITSEDVEKTVPINRAALYFGTYKSPYAIAPTEIEEFDFPEGDQNIYNHYKGEAGISLNNILNRISASLYLAEPRLLTTGVIKNDSKLIIRREVRQRVNAIAPFLTTLGEPYMVSVKINNDDTEYATNQNQYWIVEGFTKSTRYPYAEAAPGNGEVRYIRNSVKVIIDAYNGKVNFYISEPNDPIILAWRKVFPTLFQSIEDMPKSIRDHLKVPTELFEIQVSQLLKYHVTDPRTFYNGDDVWQVPMELYGEKQIPVEPYHISAQLKQTNETEFLLLQPLSPLSRPNLSAWLAARSDGDNYGQLVLLRFPSQTTIYGPEQIQALINQDPDISQQFSLWDRAGSQVIQGNLLVLPLGNSLLYVEPVYLKASQGGLPTLTRVVVSDGKKIIMAENLLEGVKSLVEEN